jgi:signal transduction histidine kinase
VGAAISVDFKEVLMNYRGLSAKLLGLTLLFVLLAEVLIYVPSLANFRNNRLNDKLTAARTAALVLDAAPSGMIPEGLTGELLDSIGVIAVAVKTGDKRKLIADLDPLPMADYEVDLREISRIDSITQSFSTLFIDKPRVLRVIGMPPKAALYSEVLLSEASLQKEMWVFTRNILWLSLAISLLTGLLVYFSLSMLFVKPMRRLMMSMIRFSKAPEKSEGVISPSKRGDEIGMAERELQRMQLDLRSAFTEKARLAGLGLAVSKIAHDLRNTLSTAHLISDRLVESKDESVQRFAPKLITALDRAIALCTSTLSYGKARERDPVKQTVSLHALIEDVWENLGSSAHFHNDIPPNYLIHADYEQIYRVFFNLMKNASEALLVSGETIQIAKNGEYIELWDNGPGLPKSAKNHLFEAFQGGARVGGTGLGLAIAREIIILHGGEIKYCETQTGTKFSIKL